MEEKKTKRSFKAKKSFTNAVDLCYTVLTVEASQFWFVLETDTQ